MNDLSFQGRDRYRGLVWAPVWVLVAGESLGAFCAYLRLGNGVALCWIAGVIAVAVGLGIYIAYRSWTTVDAAGITICRGIGRRGRTYRWQEIRWIDIRESKTRSGTALAVRISLADGRRRGLPALAHSGLDPDPYFQRDFARVVKWWELSTDPATRFVPPDTQFSRRAPTVLGAILVMLIAGTVVLVVGQGH